MKRFVVVAITMIAMLLVGTVAGTFAQGMKAGKADMAKSKYVTVSSHTKEECLKAMDDISAQNPKLLDKCWWGCMSGDHTAYAVVEAGSEQEALNMVPADVRGKAKVTKVSKITSEQIKQFHKKM